MPKVTFLSNKDIHSKKESPVNDNSEIGAYSNELSENNRSSIERYTRGCLSGNSASIHKTENAAIEQGSFAGLEDHFFQKMMKSQSVKRQRAIADQTEKESQDLLTRNSIGGDRQFLKDYTMSSKTINENIRQGKTGTTVQKGIDKALSTLQSGNNEKKVVYRIMTYADNEAFSPWHSQKGNRMNAGDIVSDRTYLSTSAHRGFLDFKHKEDKGETQYVKMALLSNKGINIADISQYNNESEKRVFDQASSKTLTERLKGPPAGQAEILFPKETRFKIHAIKQDGRNVYVLLSDIAANDTSDADIKEMFSGEKLSV
ncbi:ADP-ribosyltransferase [Xenorhabdus bovienii]|uniref:NAD(+)--protein-arginine ADP-ribosyltransferase n=1 Tax=Xenorhabdus bovienii str. feltiae Moldova TaxID=1398200 RepID=A0A077NMM0_XENBV